MIIFYTKIISIFTPYIITCYKYLKTIQNLQQMKVYKLMSKVLKGILNEPLHNCLDINIVQIKEHSFHSHYPNSELLVKSREKNFIHSITIRK